MTTPRGFASKEVIALTGVTRRQLAYWRDTGLIVPAEVTAGGHARYSFTDLIALKTAKALLDAGVSLQRLRTTLVSLRRLLPALTRPLSELSIIATRDIVMVLHHGHAFEPLSGQHWIIPVAELERELADLRAGRPAAEPVQGELFPLLECTAGAGR